MPEKYYNASMRIILASKSPRRLEIMRRHGIEPILMPTDTDETLFEGIEMCEAAETLAERKARACYEQLQSAKSDYSDCIIIGADTIVYKNEIMGKPSDYDDAFRMLSLIRNTHHYVVTGVALIDVPTAECKVFSDVTEVFCKDYTDEQIAEYIEKEQPYDKAGSYAIQGPFGEYIDHIDGDYENVVGLPYYRIAEALNL